VADFVTIAAAIAAVVAAMLVALSRRPPYTLDEAAAIAATVTGAAQAGGGAADQVLVWVLRVFADVTDAFDRASIAVEGGRAVMVELAVFVAALVWVLGRQLTGSRGVAAIAVLLLAGSPCLVGLQLVVDPVNIAAPCLAGAAVAIAPGAGIRLLPLVMALLLPALVCAPFLVAAVPILVASGWGHRPVSSMSRAGQLVGGTLVAAWVVAAHIVVAGRAPQLWPHPLATNAGPSWPEAVLVLLAAAGVVSSLADDRLRGIAATVLALAPAAAYAPDRLAVVVAPLTAVLTAAVVVSVAEVAWRRSRHGARPGRRAKTLARRAAVVTSAAIVAMVGTAAWVRAPQPGDNGLATAVDEAERWVTDNLAPGDARLLVDGAVWVDLVRAGHPRYDLVLAAPAAPPDAAATDAADPRPLIVVATPALGLPAAGLTDRLLAQFGENAAGVAIVAQRVPAAWISGDKQEAASDARERAEEAAALLGNPRLTVASGAERVVRAGQLDPRVLAVLATLVAEYRLDIADFPAVPGEEGLAVPRRCMRILHIGERGGDQGEAALRELADWLHTRGAPYRPLRSEFANVGAEIALDVCYSALSPVELLSAPLTP
jgi:hypothetical protein